MDELELVRELDRLEEIRERDDDADEEALDDIVDDKVDDNVEEAVEEVADEDDVDDVLLSGGAYSRPLLGFVQR